MNHDDAVIARRGFGEMTELKKIYNYASIVTAQWFYEGRRYNFTDYELVESETRNPYYSLTLSEYAKLRLIQKNFQDRRANEKNKCPIPHDPDEEDPQWKFVRSIDCDSYIQEVWENRYGERCMRTVIK